MSSSLLHRTAPPIFIGLAILPLCDIRQIVRSPRFSNFAASLVSINSPLSSGGFWPPNGYYRDGVVFINRDLAPAGVAAVAQLSDRLLKVALEEVAHYVTGATDNSRDFQDYLLDLAVKLSREL